jgi:hypothetical protein
LKRQKVTEDCNNILEELVITPVKKRTVARPVKRQRSASKMTKKRLIQNDENKEVSSPKVKKLTSSNHKQCDSPARKEKCRKRSIKNSYYKIINNLPQEVRSRIDWSKENLDDM